MSSTSLPMQDHDYVGVAEPHESARLHVAGKAVYIEIVKAPTR